LNLIERRKKTQNRGQIKIRSCANINGLQLPTPGSKGVSLLDKRTLTIFDPFVKFFRDAPFELTSKKNKEKAMNLDEFTNSQWAKEAASEGAKQKVINEFPEWIKKVGSSELVGKALRLWDYLWSGRASVGDIVIVIAALLYLISPIDLVPDFIPFVGWLDDVAVATLVLSYLDKRASEVQATQ
jgi:uncharacterized membrane protein YkvA (DUF1232 family)